MMDEKDNIDANFLDEDTEEIVKNIAKDSIQSYFTQFCEKLTAWFTPERINGIIDQFIENARNAEGQEEEEEEEPQPAVAVVAPLLGTGRGRGRGRVNKTPDEPDPISQSCARAAGSNDGSSGGVHPSCKTMVQLNPSQLEHQKRVEKDSTTDACATPGDVVDRRTENRDAKLTESQQLKKGDEMVEQVPVTQASDVKLETRNSVAVAGAGDLPRSEPANEQKKVENLSVKVPVVPKPDVKPETRNVVRVPPRQEPVKDQKKRDEPAARARTPERRPPRGPPAQRSPKPPPRRTSTPPRNPPRSTSVAGRNQPLSRRTPMYERVLRDPQASRPPLSHQVATTQMVSNEWSGDEEDFDERVRTYHKTHKELKYFK